jgi:hypothetical protein
MEGGYSTIEPLYPGLFFFHTLSYVKEQERARTVIFSAQSCEAATVISGPVRLFQFDYESFFPERLA